MKNPVRVDLANGQIIITRKFAEQAKTIGTTEFKYLQEIRMAHPDLEIVQRTIEKNESKKTYKNLTYANMEAFIVAQNGAESAEMNEYKTIKRLSEGKNGPYAYVKKWFLNKYASVLATQEKEEK